ncbi:MAG: ABC transporter ATP-binding protein [Candidatus Kapaibacterium sp.]|nr:ABC transporter ATP-binding protein [Ignavibacteria bacterium]
MSFLEVKNIVKSYGKLNVLKNISFEMGAKNRLALIGKSGSGKTTMLRIIAGLEIPDSGKIEIEGTTVTSENNFIKPEKRNIGYVFQNHSLFPHLDVYSNIAFGIEKKNKSEKLEIIKSYLSMLGLEDKLYSYPHQLSGGEKQRIAIIRTLASKPNLLLLDEPFSNLDKNTKEKLKVDLKQILIKEQIPTIMITHDADDSFDLADEVILLDEGNIVARGVPEELYKYPINEHSAKFFSESDIIDKSELNNQFFNFFNLNSNRICIPPQCIVSDENGVEAEIINHKFVGTGYMVSLNIMGSELKMFSVNRIDNITIRVKITQIIEL